MATGWIGSRHLLRVFSGHTSRANEVRFASATVLVLGGRYRRALNRHVMAEKGDLFRGAIEH